MAEREWPVRALNHATGYPYTAHDHCQKWTMPDGSAQFTGWIAHGDADYVSERIRSIGDEIERLQARHELLCQIYQTVSKEES